MRTSNPILSDKAFRDNAGEGVMTLRGTVFKTVILLVLTVITASLTWQQAFAGNQLAMPLTFGGAIIGFITAIVLAFKRQWAAFLAPVYALAEGLFLGGISAIYERQFDGLVFQAVLLTFGTLFALLAAYSTGLIKPTENFKLGVAAATGGIALLYLASMVLGFFHIHIPGIFGNGLIGIVFSAFVVIVAALNLVLDFDFIENGCANGAPRLMEWYAAFGLLVTLVWLYLEILRLLSKLARR